MARFFEESVNNNKEIDYKKINIKEIEELLGNATRLIQKPEIYSVIDLKEWFYNQKLEALSNKSVENIKKTEKTFDIVQKLDRNVSISKKDLKDLVNGLK